MVDPDKGTDIVSLGMVSGLVVRDGNVAFAIEVEPERGPPARAAAQGGGEGGRGAARRAVGHGGADGADGAARPQPRRSRRRRWPDGRAERGARSRASVRSSRWPPARAASANRRWRPIWRWGCGPTGSGRGARCRHLRPLDAAHARDLRPAPLARWQDSDPDGKLRPQMHVDGLPRAGGHADDLARADGDERLAADAARAWNGASSTSWWSTCRPAPATRS